MAKVRLSSFWENSKILTTKKFFKEGRKKVFCWVLKKRGHFKSFAIRHFVDHLWDHSFNTSDRTTSNDDADDDADADDDDVIIFDDVVTGQPSRVERTSSCLTSNILDAREKGGEPY